MAEISIVKAAACQIGSLLAQEAQDLYAVKDKVEHLERELDMMHAFLRDVEVKKHYKGSEVLRTAIYRIRDLAYEAEDIVEKYIVGVARKREQEGIFKTLKWSCGLICHPSDIISHHQLGSETDALREEISQLESQLRIYKVPGSSSTSLSEQHIHSKAFLHMLEDNPVGLDQYTNILVGKLVDSDNSTSNVISISGMGGLGKSTLAKKVYKDKEVRRYFNRFAWAYVSQEFQSSDVWTKIYLDLYPNDDYKRKKNYKREKINKLLKAELPGELDQELKQNNCLVVLDDLWTFRDWTLLQPAFQSIQGSGSKLLITTRSRELLEYVDPRGYLQELLFLNEEQSWELFRKRIKPVHGEIDLEFEKEKFGKEMVAKCGGLPLAIVALSGILTRKSTTKEWEHINKNIDAYLNFEGSQQHLNETISQVLELSYDDLPYYLKPSFLYLASFPQGFEIPVEKLWHRLGSEGLLMQQPTMDEDTLRCIATSHLNELALRYLILVGEVTKSGKIKTCRLHDMIRDMCVKKAREENFLHVMALKEENASCSIHKSIGYVKRNRLHRLAMHNLVGRDVEPFTSTNTLQRWLHLRSMILSLGPNFDPSNIVILAAKAFSSLRVLEFEGYNFYIEGKSLPNEIGDLIFLRYLSLKGTSVEMVPSSIGKLRHLVILDLRVLSYLLVPNELWKMRSLKHLYLPKTLKCHPYSGPLRFTGLTHLETLVNFNPNKCHIEDLCKMTHMKTLSFGFDDRLERGKSLKSILACSTIQSITIRKPMVLRIDAKRMLEEDPNLMQQLSNTYGSNFPNFQFVLYGLKVLTMVNLESVLPSTLVYLSLGFCQLESDPMPILGKLPQLKCLSLFECMEKKVKEIVCSQGGFPLLTTLVFYRLIDVEEWKVEEGALPNLIRLCVQKCNHLKRKGVPSELLAKNIIVTDERGSFQNPQSLGFKKWVM